MKDFPVFPTEYGVVSLTLKEIPYRETAYIHVQAVQPGKMKELLEECCGFCRACGAETVLAGGAGDFSDYPCHGSVWEMSLVRQESELTDASVWPVTAETVAQFRAIYNKAMREVDYAATLTSREEKEILASCGAYFVHRAGELLGIGWMADGELRAIASVVPGMGETVARSLFSTVSDEHIRLEVASGNRRAIRLYEKLGFLRTGEVFRWYQLHPADLTNSQK